jgi:hypothetical protein
MKIDYAILSTNEKPLYKDFWPVVKPVWINYIKIKPILVIISDIDEVIDHGDYIIFKINKIEGVDTGLQSQIARIWITKFYQNEVCLISDIDMLPMNEDYFKKNVEDVDEDSLVIYSADAYPKQKKRFPMCYNAAKGKTFTEILELDGFNSFEDFCRKLVERGEGWNTDELFFGEKVYKYKNQKRIVKLSRGWISGIAKLRIDRIKWKYEPQQVKTYIDSHLVRPYTTYKIKIDKLIEELTS